LRTRPFAEAALTGAGLYTEGLNILRRYAFDQGPVDHVDILAVEQEFNIVVDGHKLNGFIDRVDRIDDEAIQIIDYKSNRRLFTGDELRGDLQMSIYGLAARELYPWAKRVLFAFHMLRFGGLVQTALRTARAIDDAAGYVAALGERSERDVEWTPVLNENCAFCDHRRRCPLYERAIDGKLPIVRVANTDDLDAVSREREHVANVAKAAYARKSELDEAIKAALSLRDELRAGGRVYRFQHPSETAYDVDRVVRAFTAAGVDRDEIERRVLAVDARAVEELRVEVVTNFANGRSPLLLKADLEAAAKKVPMSPRLDSRADKTVATKATDGAKKEKAK
jgi:putative RecB family exonuclease